MIKILPKPALAALNASAVLMVALSVAFYADLVLPSAKNLLSFLIIFFELMAPIYILEKNGIKPKSYNIYAHKLEVLIDNIFAPFRAKKSWPDTQAIASETISLVKICLWVLPLYVLAYCAYIAIEANLFSMPAAFKLTFPPHILLEFATQIVVVALPEEVFFRGFVQSALLSAWPNKFFIKGIPVGRAIILTNIIFALSHFVGGFAPARLLTFFPGILFSYLVYKNKSIYSAVLFHAICNIVAHILYLSH